MRFRCTLNDHDRVGEFVQELMFFGLIDIRVTRDVKDTWHEVHPHGVPSTRIDKVQISFEIGNLDRVDDHAIMAEVLGDIEKKFESLIITPFTSISQSMWDCLEGITLE